MDVHGVARVFAAVGEPSRLALLRFLLDQEHCVSQCTEEIGVTQGAVSKQLGVLAAAGLLTRRRASRRTYYRVKDPELRARMLADAAAVAAPPRALGHLGQLGA